MRSFRLLPRESLWVKQSTPEATFNSFRRRWGALPKPPHLLTQAPSSVGKVHRTRCRCRPCRTRSQKTLRLGFQLHPRVEPGALALSPKAILIRRGATAPSRPSPVPPIATRSRWAREPAQVTSCAVYLLVPTAAAQPAPALISLVNWSLFFNPWEQKATLQ